MDYSISEISLSILYMFDVDELIFPDDLRDPIFIRCQRTNLPRWPQGPNIHQMKFFSITYTTTTIGLLINPLLPSIHSCLLACMQAACYPAGQPNCANDPPSRCLNVGLQNPQPSCLPTHPQTHPPASKKKLKKPSCMPACPLIAHVHECRSTHLPAHPLQTSPSSPQ